MIQVSDYFVAVIEPRMLQQYREAVNFIALIKGQCAQTDEQEAVLFAILDSREVDKATGYSLDMIASIFSVIREPGVVDADFRDLIKKQASRRNYGTPEDIIRICKDVLGAGWIKYLTTYPAGCALLSDITLDQGILDNLCPAGVSLANASFLNSQAGDYIIDASGNRIFCVS